MSYFPEIIEIYLSIGFDKRKELMNKFELGSSQEANDETIYI